jgi:hypothetical protein
MQPDVSRTGVVQPGTGTVAQVWLFCKPQKNSRNAQVAATFNTLNWQLSGSTPGVYCCINAEDRQ